MSVEPGEPHASSPGKFVVEANVAIPWSLLAGELGRVILEGTLGRRWLLVQRGLLVIALGAFGWWFVAVLFVFN